MAHPYVAKGAGEVIYTDGLPDSIPGDDPGASLCRALDGDLTRTMSNLKALVDPRFNEDDVTVLLVKRCASEPSTRDRPSEPADRTSDRASRGLP